MNVVVSLPQLIARRVSLSYPYRQTHTHTHTNVVSLPQLIVRCDAAGSSSSCVKQNGDQQRGLSATNLGRSSCVKQNGDRQRG